MFLDLMQINPDNDEDELKSKEILKMFKEFVFLNEEENGSPFSDPHNLNKRIYDNANNNENLKNKRKPRSISKERIDMEIEEESGELSEQLNRSKETKDNFNNKSYSNNNNNSNSNSNKCNGNNNNNDNNNNNNNTKNNFLNKSNNNFKNSNSINNGSFVKKLICGVKRNMNSSGSLKFVSRKSKMVRALDLYDVLVNYLINSKEKEKPGSKQNRKGIRKKDEEEENVLFKFKGDGSNCKSDFENDSDKENINIKKFEVNEFNKYVTFKNNPISKNSNPDPKKHYYNLNNINNNFKSTKFLPTKIRKVKEYRFRRQNFIFSVRIQEIDNYIVLIFENLDEEKKQIQNNLIKSIKNQYIITISHELNNPLNGLVHSIEELEFDEEEKKKLVVKKIKRFKFMIKFFLKNIITNFKFFLNEPIQKKPSNISFGFILESIKRSLFEFYEYKNIKVVHDFSGLNKLVLQYDYFYFRYLLKNIFIYFYYKIPRNEKLVIEIEKENEVIELNNLIMGKDTSEIDSESSNQSNASSGVLYTYLDQQNTENKIKSGKLDDKICIGILTKNLNVSKNLSNNKNNKYNSKLAKKKITMIFKTEQRVVNSKKSSNNIFDKAYLEHFDIENSIQTLEMLIESINKISKLLGIKIDFSNFNNKNSSIIMNLNYYFEEEDDSFTCNDINEYSEEYEKYKANCVFSINRTLINEEKKVYLNPTLNMKHFGEGSLNKNNNMGVKNNFTQMQRFKVLNSNLMSGNEASSNAKSFVVKTFNHLDQVRDLSPIANRPEDDNECNSNDFFSKVKSRNLNNNVDSNFNHQKLNSLNYNTANTNDAVYESSNVETNANAADILSRNRSRPHTSNSMYFSSNPNEAPERNNIKEIHNNNNNNKTEDSDKTPSLSYFKNINKFPPKENINLNLSNFNDNNNNNDDLANNFKNKSGYFVLKAKAKQQLKHKSLTIKDKHESSLFSKQFTNTRNPEQQSKSSSTLISNNIPKIFVTQYDVEKEGESEREREKEKFGTELISIKRQNIYIEEALENKSNADEESHSKNFIMESLDEHTLNDANLGNSFANFSAHESHERNIVKEKAYSEHMVSLGSSGSNSICFNNSMHNQNIFTNENANDSQDKDDVFHIYSNLDKSKNKLDDERFIDKILNLKENLRVKNLQKDLDRDNKTNNSFDNNNSNNVDKKKVENFDFLKKQNEKNLGAKFSGEKNNQIFFNTYNTYLNVDNIEKLNVLSSSIKGKNETASKDDFLKKYCNIKTEKNRFALSSSNKLMKENNINNIKIIKKNNNNNNNINNNNGINNNYQNNNNNENFSPDHSLTKTNEAAEFSSTKFYKPKQNDFDKSDNYNQNKRTNMKNKLKEIENPINPPMLNFSVAAAASAASENSNTHDSIKASNTSVVQLNSTPQNLIEVSEEMNENYDTYDQNLNNTNNISSIKLNHPTFAKNPFGNSSQMLNINYIRSPRLFFHSRIPNLRSSKRRESAVSRNSSNKSGKNKCECNDILLVDDELFNISSMNFLLKKKKLKADTAMNGRESIQKIEEKLKKNCTECAQKEYKLIFMDIMMPEMDGIEASRVIQQMVKKGVLSQNVKILILTAHDTEIIKKRAVEISIIKEFVGKPVKKSVVDELLNKQYFGFGG